MHVVDSVSNLVNCCDNGTIIFYYKNNKRSSDSNHIEIKHLVVKDNIKDWQTVIKHIRIEAMIADPLIVFGT